MDNDELMVGDWVEIDSYAFNPCDTRDEDWGIHQIKTNEEIDKYCDWMRPIDLTKEIIERNSIHGDLPILFNDGKLKYLVVESKYISKEYNNEYYSYCVVISCDYPGGTFYVPIAKIEYVHELQHILKDLKIEKEIKL